MLPTTGIEPMILAFHLHTSATRYHCAKQALLRSYLLEVDVDGIVKGVYIIIVFWRWENV